MSSHEQKLNSPEIGLGGASTVAGEGGWRHNKAQSVSGPDAAIRQMEADQAQAWCNFVVFEPASLPADLRIVKKSMRPEAPPDRPEGLDLNGRFGYGLSNRATYRLTLASGPVRIHIKQFLYDLGPPSFDHPCFWLKRPRPFEVGNDIGWIGHDYRGLLAASLDRDRTMIEISVVEGSLAPESLEEICAALQPVSEAARQLVLGTAYASLCYQRRYPDLIVTVPMGYWKHRRRPKTLVTTPYRAAEVPLHLLSMKVEAAPRYEFDLDTLLVFGDPAAPQELEWIFYHRRLPGHYVRFLMWPDSSPERMPYPPQFDLQPGRSRTFRLKSQTFHHAYLEPRYGQHAAVWKSETSTRMLLVKPAPWTGRTWFKGLLAGLAKPSEEATC